MTAFAINPPYPVFTGLDGEPLDSGKIYVGTANLDPVTNPVAIYWDSALTIAATQPIRTSGGYAVRNGTPAIFYADNGPVSITVKDAVDVTVFTAASVSSLSGPDGAEFIGYGDVTVADILDNALYDVSYGVVADGVTDDAAATNDFLAALSLRGGIGVMKPGPRLFGSQVFIDRNQPNNITLLGYGVSIKTTHSGSAFWIQNGYDFYATEICGLSVVETSNALARCGFEQTRTTNVTWRNCYVNSNAGVVNSNYGGFFLHNSDPADNDTGCFWTAFPGSGVRRGGSGEFNYGVLLQGAANATWFDGIKITGVVDAIKIAAETGQGYLSNAVIVTGAAIEGTSGHAVRVVGGGAATTCPGGLIIANSRFETVDGAVLSLEGCTISAPRWPVVNLSAIDTTVSPSGDLVNNPNNLRYDLAYKDRDRTERAITVVTNGQVIESALALNDVLELRAGNINSGLSIGDADGSPLQAWLRFVGSGVVELAANVASLFTLAFAGVSGISGTATRANNLRGTASLTAATSVAVTFGTAEADASYFVQLTPSAANGGCWVTSKGTGGFTINFNAPFTGSVDWLLIR